MTRNTSHASVYLLALGVIAGLILAGPINKGASRMSKFVPARVRSFYGRRKHKKLAVGITAVVPILMAGAAFAAYFLAGSGQGTGHTNLGSKGSTTLTVHVCLPGDGQPLPSCPTSISQGSALSPGGQGPMQVTVDNSTSKNVSTTGVTFGAITVTDPNNNNAAVPASVCNPAWFQIISNPGYNSASNPLPGNTSGDNVWDGQIAFTDAGATVDQSGCSGLTLNVPANVS